jgi:hypothetical protein
LLNRFIGIVEPGWWYKCTSGLQYIGPFYFCLIDILGYSLYGFLDFTFILFLSDSILYFLSLLFYTFIFFNHICVVNLFKIRNLSGEWISAPPIPGTFVCNIGDMLKVYYTWILLEIWWSFNSVWKMYNCRYTPMDCMSQLCIVW